MEKFQKDHENTEAIEKLFEFQGHGTPEKFAKNLTEAYKIKDKLKQAGMEVSIHDIYKGIKNKHHGSQL